jgi:hypothetical protein
MRRMTRSAVVLAVTLAPLALPTAAAAGQGGVGDPAFAGVNMTSAGQAGYELVGPPTLAGARATFTVPSVSCVGALSGVSLGVFVYGARTVSSAGVWLTCQGGATVYYGALEANQTTRFTSFTPRPGDRVVVSIYQSARRATAVLDDVRAGRTATLAGRGAANMAVFVGADILTSGGFAVPVPDFGMAEFTHVAEDGQWLGGVDARPVDLESGGAVQIHTGAVGSTGSTFVETWRHG